jgi:hypothetical protein
MLVDVNYEKTDDRVISREKKAESNASPKQLTNP